MSRALRVLVGVLSCVLGACAGAQEPSEAEMKAAAEYQMNHPPGVTVTDPIKITFFKKEACNKPNEQGFYCTFTVQVQSANALAGMYGNVPGASFYKDDKGKWQMRPPF